MSFQSSTPACLLPSLSSPHIGRQIGSHIGAVSDSPRKYSPTDVTTGIELHALRFAWWCFSVVVSVAKSSFLTERQMVKDC